MNQANIPTGDRPVTKAKAAKTALGLRDGAKKAKQQPAAWAGKEVKI